MFKELLTSAIAIGIIGLVFGIILAFAAKFFHVQIDSKIAAIRAALPGINCGGCGYPGCDLFAEKVSTGEARVNGCPVSSKEQKAEIAKIMGVEQEDVEPLFAVVRCIGTNDKVTMKYEYEGIQDCAALAALGGGNKGCEYSCLGMGNCSRVCPTDAIEIDNGIAIVDRKKCIACGKCAIECPRDVISLIPKSAEPIIMCSSLNRGKEVKSVCKVGCIGCGICKKVCQFDAIEMKDNNPIIDYKKCEDCGLCAEKCPTGCIEFDFKKRKIAFIEEEKCIGCTLCKKACQFEAVEGERKEIHKIISDKCVGCRACYEACPTDAVHLISR
ncbi:MAG: RnfABCDGE type electron transport complex subunit B [Clostridiales bacterium]|nr:RnfABCDGE type electron transport complex subunit B [Clostridiales bacterium]